MDSSLSTTIDIKNNLVIKEISDLDLVHYKNLLSHSFIRNSYPKIYSIDEQIKNDEKIHKLILQKIGEPVSNFEPHIQKLAKDFVINYVNELHKVGLFHGDILTSSGIGIHLDNILFEKDTNKFYIIDFCSNSSLQIELRLKQDSIRMCSHLPFRKKRNKSFDNEFKDNSIPGKYAHHNELFHPQLKTSGRILFN